MAGNQGIFIGQTKPLNNQQRSSKRGSRNQIFNVTASDRPLSPGLGDRPDGATAKDNCNFIDYASILLIDLVQN
ncbi:MAG: hypothetical protein EA001_16070 [Oscillatoriales cyanobacterium]|nr:MAG: hypothetical protein EA001_16070 [Oscillatoriales cyanobacterium]